MGVEEQTPSGSPLAVGSFTDAPILDDDHRDKAIAWLPDRVSFLRK